MTFAQFVGSGSTGIIGIINVVIAPVIFALAFLVFIYGVVKYFFIRPSGAESFGDRGGYGEGRQFILWGLIGMVVLFSVWGFVNLMLSTLGIMPRA
jgi:hypothetical protein